MKVVIVGISVAVVDCGKLLDEILHIWSSLQEDTNMLKIQENVQEKQQ